MKPLYLAQIIVSCLLVLFILIQSQGVGLSAVFGGEGNVYRTKRGAEKIIFILTIILAIAFLGLGVANVLI